MQGDQDQPSMRVEHDEADPDVITVVVQTGGADGLQVNLGSVYFISVRNLELYRIDADRPEHLHTEPVKRS